MSAQTSARRRVVIVPRRQVAYFAAVVDDVTGEELYLTEAHDSEGDAIASAKSTIEDDEFLVGVNECREIA